MLELRYVTDAVRNIIPSKFTSKAGPDRSAVCAFIVHHGAACSAGVWGYLGHVMMAELWLPHWETGRWQWTC
jgi:hypothetical protein